MPQTDILELLGELNQGWDDEYWLFAANGTLCLMKKVDGKRIILDNGSVDPDFVIEEYPHIECDGGGW